LPFFAALEKIIKLTSREKPHIMKYRLLLLVICLTVPVITALAETDSMPAIMLQKIKKNGHAIQKVIKPFKHATVWTDTRKYHPDSLKPINGNALIAKKDTIPFSKIVRLRVHDPNHGAKIAEGVLLSFAGAGSIFTGVLAFGVYGATQTEMSEFKTWGVLYSIAGAILVPAGIVLALSRRTFDTQSKWTIHSAWYKSRKH
jgi:hypothetical protein